MPPSGRTSRFANLVLAAGHARVGMSLGPVTGRLVARLAAGTAPANDLRLLDPERFG